MEIVGGGLGPQAESGDETEQDSAHVLIVSHRHTHGAIPRTDRVKGERICLKMHGPPNGPRGAIL